MQKNEGLFCLEKHDPVEAKENGKKAREKCKREYSWNVMEEKLAAIFEEYKTD